MSEHEKGDLPEGMEEMPGSPGEYFEPRKGKDLADASEFDELVDDQPEKAKETEKPEGPAVEEEPPEIRPHLTQSYCTVPELNHVFTQTIDSMELDEDKRKDRQSEESKSLMISLADLTAAIKDVSQGARNAGERFDRAEKYSGAFGKQATLEVDGKDYRLGNMRPKPKSGKGGIISGKEAANFVHAKKGGMERTPLYSSGFYITHRAPQMDELNVFYNYVSSHLDTLGNRLGSVYYAFSDIDTFIKNWELAASLILSSNLKKWDNGNRLANYFSLNDFDLFALRIGRLMHPRGYKYRMICGAELPQDPESKGPFKFCRWSTDETVDLNDFQFTNFMRIPDEFIPQIAGGEMVDGNMARAYQDALVAGFNHFDLDGYRFHLSVPSIARYINLGRRFHTKMIKAIGEEGDDASVDNFIRFNKSGIYLAWMDRIEALDEDGNVDFVLEDDESMELVINQFEAGDPKTNLQLVDGFETFIQKSAVTHIGHVVGACPECGKLPLDREDGFLPFDPRAAFFSMSVTKLTRPF